MGKERAADSDDESSSMSSLTQNPDAPPFGVDIPEHRFRAMTRDAMARLKRQYSHSASKMKGVEDYPKWSRNYQYLRNHYKDIWSGITHELHNLLKDSLPKSVKETYESILDQVMSDGELESGDLNLYFTDPAEFLAQKVELFYGDSVDLAVTPLDLLERAMDFSYNHDEAGQSMHKRLEANVKAFVESVCEDEGLSLTLALLLRAVPKDLLGEFGEIATMEEFCKAQNELVMKRRVARLRGATLTPSTSNKRGGTNNNNKKGLDGGINNHKRLCHYCQKPGHIEKDCWQKHPEKGPKREAGPPTQRGATKDDRPSARTRSQQKPGGGRASNVLGVMTRVGTTDPIMVDLVLHLEDGDIPSEAFFDTGAPSTLISEDEAQRIGLAYERSGRPPVILGDGKTRIDVVATATAVVTLPEYGVLHRSMEFTVLEDLEPPLIIGRSDIIRWKLLSGVAATVEAQANLMDSVVFAPELTEVQRMEILEAMDAPRIFESRTNQATVSVEHEIHLTTDVPVYSRPYHVSRHKRELIRGLVQELLDAGVVEPCNSPYASPVIPVGKKDGSQRLVVDFRRLNEITVKQHWPLPLITDIVDLLFKAHFVARVDFKNAYYQLGLRRIDRDKAAFITMDGQYRFLRMAMGLSGAPSTF